MRRTRAANRYAIRRIKREEDDIVKERCAATITRDRNRDFWTEVRKIASKTGSSVIMESLSQTRLLSCSPINTNPLYSNASYSISDMYKIKQRIQSRIAKASTMDALSANIFLVEVGTCVAMLSSSVITRNSPGDETPERDVFLFTIT